MKSAPTSKTSSLSPDSKPVDTAARRAGKASGATASPYSSGGPSRRTQSARRQPATAAAAPRNGQKAGKPQPSAVYTSESMKTIREDRGTTIALYTLFGAVLAGVIYFIALLLLV